MSRERVRTNIRPFMKRGEWDVDKSRAAGPRTPYSDLERPAEPIQIDVNNVEIGARNRSGERRRTGRTLKG